MATDETESYLSDRFEYTYDTDTPASIAIVLVISTLENVRASASPDELGFTLYDYIDPDALDTLVGDGCGDGDVVVDVQVGKYDVSIDNAGHIFVSRCGT